MNKINYVNEDKSTIWDSILGNIGGWLSGAADITRAAKGTPDEVNYVQVSSGSGTDNKTMIYVGIGAVALIIILIFLFKK